MGEWIMPGEVHDRIVSAAYKKRGYTGKEAAQAAAFSNLTARHGIKTHNAIKALHLDELFGSKIGGCVPGATIEKLKSLPAFFDTAGLEIQQFEAVSKDGSRIPYFQVSRQSLKLDGKNPTLLYGYGGFEIPMLSRYSAGLGASWLERGGTYVLANIRGGGEFGPAWHNAARKENRQRAYDDFIAVAESLLARKITSPIFTARKPSSA